MDSETISEQVHQDNRMVWRSRYANAIASDGVGRCLLLDWWGRLIKGESGRHRGMKGRWGQDHAGPPKPQYGWAGSTEL